MAGVADVIEAVGTAVTAVLGGLAVFLTALHRFRKGPPRHRGRHAEDDDEAEVDA